MSRARAIIEMFNEESWHDKVVKNPKTGHMVKVSSLDPEDQAKYKPKSASHEVAKSMGSKPTKHSLSDGSGVHVKDHIGDVHKHLKANGYTHAGSKHSNAVGEVDYHKKGDHVVKTFQGNDREKGGTHIRDHQGDIPKD